MQMDEQKIQEMRDYIADRKDSASQKFSGMSYAEGLIEALDWILGDTTDEELIGDFPSDPDYS